MLESMINNPVPTRAEISDVANAIFDGTDAVMLSEETTLGKFPVEAVTVMSTVAKKVENDPIYMERIIDMQRKKHEQIGGGIDDAVTNEVIDIANAVKAKVIIALTHGGSTARMIARYHPLQHLIAMTPEEISRNQLLVTFGCTPVLIGKIKTVNEAVRMAKTYCVKNKFGKKGDKMVIALGMPFGTRIDTNMILVEIL
jgi:pyruvate kinase